mgnify:CR=1 FL=1
MELTNDNYYSQEAREHYASFSQFKDFCGTSYYTGCEEMALKKLKGEYIEEKSQALLCGSYVDAAFEGTLEQWIEANKDIVYTSRGGKYAHFKKADDAILRASQDKLFMQFMDGEKQKILTGEFFGLEWQGKLDVYHDKKCIVDLKYVEDLYKTFWVKDLGHVTWVEYYGYDMQAAIYQKLVELNTGDKLPYYLAVVDKKEHPNIEIIQIPQTTIDNALSVIEYQSPRYNDVKTGKVEPDRCEKCNYCVDTKKLVRPIMLDELI